MYWRTRKSRLRRRSPGESLGSNFLGMGNIRNPIKACRTVYDRTAKFSARKYSAAWSRFRRPATRSTVAFSSPNFLSILTTFETFSGVLSDRVSTSTSGAGIRYRPLRVTYSFIASASDGASCPAVLPPLMMTMPPYRRWSAAAAIVLSLEENPIFTPSSPPPRTTMTICDGVEITII